MITQKFFITSCAILYSCFIFLAQTASVNQNKYKTQIQAHRGGAAIYPENTIPAMIHAASIGIPVLELDLQISKDGEVIVSHDAFFNHTKALTPSHDTIPAQQETQYSYYTMTYDSIRKYDVGSLKNEQFPKRKNISAIVPRVSDLIDCVETYTQEKNLPPVSYNIEIKSSPEKDNIFTPDYQTYADICIQTLLKKKLKNRLLIQCFDPRTLNYIHQKYPQIQLSYLVEDYDRTFEEQMALLNFTPQVYSPEYHMVTNDLVRKVKKNGMKIIPWTVDTKEEVLRLSDLKVDAIISNKPDSLKIWLKI